MRWFDPRQMLSIPKVYESFQELIRGPGYHQRFVRDYLKPTPGDAILDIGCGTGAILEFLPRPINYTGIDISPPYIARAQAKYGDIARFMVADATLPETELGGPYDLAFSLAALHHMSDEAIAGLIRSLLRCLRSGGRYVTIDPCFIENQNLIAYLVSALDRGGHVRTPNRLQSLFADSFDISTIVVHNPIRLPSTVVVMDLTRKK